MLRGRAHALLRCRQGGFAFHGELFLTYTAVRLAAHYMKQNTPDEASSLKGSIICTASNAGLYPFPIAPLYSATKHAVVGLVRSLGRPLQEQNIQINALAPNVIRK